MKRLFPVWPLLAALLLATSAFAQGREGGLPRPPTAAEVAGMPAEVRLRQQVALKAVWLERLIRAREERHRVSRENAAASVQQAQRLGAPAGFVSMLRLQAQGNLSPRERYELEAAQQAMLAAYGVDAREMRFYVEGSELTAEQLREVAAWLPLQAFFNQLPTEAEAPADEQAVASCYADFLAAHRELAAALAQVSDRSSADAAAEALLPTLERYHSALRQLQVVPPALRAEAQRLHARDAESVAAATRKERARLQENAWYGSSRLQSLNELLL